jgi:hypothetical protein
LGFFCKVFLKSFRINLLKILFMYYLFDFAGNSVSRLNYWKGLLITVRNVQSFEVLFSVPSCIGLPESEHEGVFFLVQHLKW